jgi:hypothetical protein
MALLVPSLGCRRIRERLLEKAGEKAAESAAGDDEAIEKSGRGITFKGNKPGEAITVGTGKVPDDFPKDVPIYPGAKIIGGASTGGASPSKSVSLKTEDAPAKVLAFYQSKIPASAKKLSNSTTLTYEDGGRRITIFARRGNATDDTFVVLSVTQK